MDVPSEGDDGKEPRNLEALAAETTGVARRYGEMQSAGFLGMTHKMYAHELSARAYLWVGGLSASWLRLYEPGSLTRQNLDLLRLSTVGTVVAENHVEAHVLMGVDVLRGEGWTPAFGPGLEVRTYPTRRFTVDGSVFASIFADGYPLVDSRFEVGAVLGRLDVKLGGRWIYQHYQRTPAANAFGPSLSVLIRLGP